MRTLKDIFYSDDKIGAKSLDVYLPDGECKAVFVYIHGGGIERGDKANHFREGEYLAERGYAFVSINYRMYPNAKFPEFICDSAEAIAWTKKNMGSLFATDKLYVGGSSAGGYISMMLCFDKRYLEAVGLSNKDIAGYWHDAGQPTFHFNVLKYEGYDPRRVIVDEHAPLYFVGLEEEYPPMRFIVSDNDMFARYEQTMLMLKTMEHFKYKHYDHFVANGMHCEYFNKTKMLEDGTTLASHMIEEFLDSVDSI